LVTGLDLVKLQISIANGDEIVFKQEDLELKGSAIECRINAEDPLYDFAPSSGRVPYCNLPLGPGIRVDTYLYPGCTVSGFYDSLVAKLITWGSSFDESRRRMRNALDEFIIDGINTTIPLYKTIMNEINFINGDLSTDYLDRFSIIDKMNNEIKDKINDKTKVLPGIAAVLLYSEYIKNNPNFANTSATKNVTPTNKTNWKYGGVNN
jgi:acetyl-CoA/propionyl-CoA carboxylase